MDIKATGELISSARKAQGLTQAELADKVGVTDKAVSKWERGLSFPDIALLEPLSDTLGIGITELIAGKRTQDKQYLVAEPYVKATLEISDAEIKSRKAKYKKVALIVGAVCLAIIIALSVCFGIAFTPADGMSRTKQLSLEPLNAKNEHTIELPYKVKINAGDMYAYGITPIFKSNKVNAELFKDVKNAILASGATTYADKDLDGYVFLYKDPSGRADIYTLSIVSDGVEITDSVFELYVNSDDCRTVLMPFMYIGSARKSMFRILDGQEIETRCVSPETAMDDFTAFYLATGYYDVTKTEDALTVKLKEECVSLYPEMLSEAFSVRFVSHGSVTFFIAEKL